MSSHRKPTETMRDFFKREYDLCAARVDKYFVLQSLRRDQGYFGAALFYQNEAKRWHERAMDCRRQWLVSSWRKPYLQPCSDQSKALRKWADFEHARISR